MARPKKKAEERYERVNVSITPDMMDRLLRYCQQEDRAMSWVMRKALAAYLDEKGV